MKHIEKSLKISTIVVIFATAMIAFQGSFGGVMAQNETATNNASQGNGTGQEFMQVTDVPAGNLTAEEVIVGETGIIRNNTSGNATDINGTEAIPAEQAGQEIAELPLFEN